MESMLQSEDKYLRKSEYNIGGYIKESAKRKATNEQ